MMLKISDHELTEAITATHTGDLDKLASMRAELEVALEELRDRREHDEELRKAADALEDYVGAMS